MAIELHHLHPGHDDEVSRLKERIAELEKLNHDLCERVTENDEIRLHWEEIEQTRVENERMKARIAELKQKLEDAGMRERRLKRALWLARANCAKGYFLYWCARFGVESGFTKADIRGYVVNTKRKLRTIGEWIEMWKEVEHKCLKKAEEYK